MTDHLLALTVGPVQEFIAAARRTRDLWFGSYLLSEISKAVAKAVCDQKGELIFPAQLSDEDLEPDSTLNVANVIVAALSGPDPAGVAQVAKEAARSRWRQFADRVFRDFQGVIRAEIWYDQADDVIEFYAAWVPHAPESYRADRAKLMRLLAGRKACRDFLPAKGRAGIPKSSLDGLRESVLRPPREWLERARRRVRVREGEQLDVVGMVKRTWAPETGSPRYPSVARVAADPWLRGIGATHLRALLDACRQLGGDVLHEIDVSVQRGHPHYAPFPFEGTAVFRSRHRDLQEETELSDADLAPLAQALSSLTLEHGEASPYLAVLVADGDHMGRALSRIESADEHRGFSEALAAFASDARQIVHEHCGVLIYAGGDDVVAFVPVDQCLTCARGLHDTFGHLLASWSTKTDPGLTLSVGLAIAHFMEPLEDLLGYGRAAERHAKRPRVEDRGQEERNALAVHVHKRGGGPVAMRANWHSEPDEHLQTLAGWLNERAMSGRVAYDLRKIAEVYDGWPPDSVADAIQRDTVSVMKGKQPSGESRMRQVREFIQMQVVDADSLRRMSDGLLVARQVAVAVGQARRAWAAREGSA